MKNYQKRDHVYFICLGFINSVRGFIKPRWIFGFASLFMFFSGAVTGGESTQLAYPHQDEPAVFARYVPERKGDFAWENDLVAFRAYGPELRNNIENAGFDCWLKRVDYPIIDKWYYQAIYENKSYHVDHGEGLDNYHVGDTAGCGGSALWLNGRREGLETFTDWTIHSLRPASVEFSLVYQRAINNDHYKEEKRIRLNLGSRLFSVESTFWKNGNLASDLPIAIGVTLHNGKAVAKIDPNFSWLSAWEIIDDFGLGTGVVLAEGFTVDRFKTEEANSQDNNHAVLIAHTDKMGRLRYSSGYGWEKAGEITSHEKWMYYLKKYSTTWSKNKN